MAQKLKTKNKKQAQEGRISKIEANINSTNTWPDLPQTLVDIIARQPTLMQSISYGGLTKLCISPPKKCYPNNSTSTPPFLQLFDETKGNKDENQVEPFLNVSFYRKWFWPWHYVSWARQPIAIRSDWKRYVGYSNDAIVAKGAMNPNWGSSDHIYLWYLVEGYCHRRLPEWDKRIPLVRVVKSRSCPRNLSKQNCTVMVLTGISHPAFLFYRVRGEKTSWDHQWVKQDCNLIEPHCSTKSQGKNFMTFTNAIGFNGKFYVLSLQGTLAVIDDDTDSYPPRITALSSERAVPSVLTKHFKEYLVETEGNVLLVFLISKNSIKIVDDVEVYQLNTAKLSWVRMASLGDRTLFLGSDCCMSVSASRIGCKSNSVYFTHHTADGSWWVYDMEKGFISPGWTDFTTKSPVWTEPIQEE